MLVVDDEQTSRDLATRALEKAGFRVLDSSSASEGLQLAQALRPDVVIVDILMPETSGWALLERMQNDPDLRQVPVIVMSVIDERRRSLQLGATAHLVKPVLADRLVDIVRSVLVPSRAMPGVVS